MWIQPVANMKGSFKSLLFFSLFLPYVTAYSQYFFSGYIITHSADTIHGLLESPDKARFTSFCVFKRSSSGNETMYTPETISGYRLTDDKYFVSKTLMSGG